MKNELIKLYKEFVFEFKLKEKSIWDKGGSWSKKPDLETFMNWLDTGFID